MFALPDSLTLVSTSANLRLESFLFTERGVREVRDRLTPDGVFVLYNYYRDDWLPQKIAGMLEDAFGSDADRPACTARRRRRSPRARWSALGGGHAAGRRRRRHRPSAIAPRPATDDWPFLYLLEPYIAPYYLGALAIILAFAAFLVLARRAAAGTSLRRFSPHFFLLGIAFLLLETRSLVTLQPAVRHDLARQLARVLRRPRERAARDPHQRAGSGSGDPVPLYVAPARLDRGRATSSRPRRC